SMLVALERGRAPEIEFLNGEIVRRGARFGIPTPVNARLVATVNRIFAGEEPPSLRLLRDVYECGSASSDAASLPAQRHTQQHRRARRRRHAHRWSHVAPACLAAVALVHPLGARARIDEAVEIAGQSDRAADEDRGEVGARCAAL